MKVARTLAVVSLLLLTTVAAGAASPDGDGPQSVAAAQKRLEAARANLAQAVQRIEKDPPSTADLDAAHAAVGELKEAIDAGAEHESKDLEYAKAVLAARKELRTHREYVDQRRANVHIHNHRRAIDGALATLNQRARDVEAKAASPADFEGARAAAQALRKAVDEARPFAKQDQKFASFISEVDSTLARHEKAIDERWTQLSLEKHRALLEESRQALSASLAALAKGGTDAHFEAADRAASLLSKRLEEGKALEAKDNAYHSNADKARMELVQARKRMDELWSATGLARLKAEIEPARKDLAAAGEAVRAKKPTTDQLAEAKTATIVVRKLLEKFQPQASRSRAFAEYVAEVKKTLVEVEVALQLRGLDSARADLARALKSLEGRAPSDEHFEEAKTALLVLEKTLESVHKKEPAMLKPVADARELLNTAKTTMAKRRVEVDAQRHRAKVEEARKNAAALVREINQPNVEKNGLQEAENGIKQLQAVLDEGAVFSKKDRDYALYARDVKKHLAQLNERIASRKVQLAARDGRTVLKDALAGAKARLEAAKQPESTDADIDAASKSVDAVGQALEALTSVEKQDKGYAAQADRAREELNRLNEALELAKQARTLRRLTAEALSEGASAADAAANARGLRSQKQQYEKAIAEFKSCESAGASMLEANRALAKAVVLVDGRPSTPKDVIALCAQRSKATGQLLAQVLALLAFEEGPKRSFETGKGLLARADKKSEALGQFDECVASGIILQHRNPEFKERKFEVAGTSMTLAELLKQCINHQKSLRAK